MNFSLQPLAFSLRSEGVGGEVIQGNFSHILSLWGHVFSDAGGWSSDAAPPHPSPLPRGGEGIRISWKAARTLAVLAGLVTLGAVNPEQSLNNLGSANGSVDALFDADKARFAIQAQFKGLGDGRDKAIYGATIEHAIHASADNLTHRVAIKVDAIQGSLKEVVFALSGQGEIKEVSGAGLADWSVRQGSAGQRFLVLRLRPSEKPVSSFSGIVTAETRISSGSKTVEAMSLTLEQPSLANGYVRIDAEATLAVQVPAAGGLLPIEPRFLPEALRPAGTNATRTLLAFRFLGTGYSLPIIVAPADPEAGTVVLDRFQLVGRLIEENAEFTLRALARVKNPKGASLELLSGDLALTEIASSPHWRMKFENEVFVVTFDKAGEFPLELKFSAAVRAVGGWNELHFNVAPGALQPILLQGVKPETQFRFPGAARPERLGQDFSSFVPPNGRVNLAWKEARPETEGALFFSAEQLSQIAISPGLMRQTALLSFKVMQGELGRAVLLLRGDGEITRVQGPQVLSWMVDPVPQSSDRRLTVQLNEPQKDQFSLQIQTQTPLGVFPQAVNPVQMRPEGATRVGGYFRIVNEGAVRLEVVQASGLSQISPEQFPQSEAAKALLAPQATQTFAYRFSGGAFDLRIQADNILPELAVSQVLVYRLGEAEQAIDADFEVEVREAPLRELSIRVPKRYAVARLNASGLSDYFLTEPADQPEALLRVVYGQPVSGRQLLQLRLEKNSPLGGTNWALPTIEVVKAKSVRGYLGVSAEAGFRASPATTQGLTEIATAFFPRKVPGLQAAFRVSDSAWQAGLNVERLPQSLQADTFHLFSVGEGMAYGSSIVNYLISGAPVSAFRVGLTNEYFNVEFTGKDVRNWQKIEGGYLVQLHTPVAGSYTLLVTYERPFKAQGETLLFTGAQPLDVQSEQGHNIVVSTYQFRVLPVNVSPSLVPLEPGEVPAEYRLFFDAPILAAYRYSSRPFNLQLELKPLSQADTMNQVVDRAALVTRVSKEGQVITDARYFLKNQGASNLRLSLPNGSELWSVMVNANPVVPVMTGRAHLIPLAPTTDPNAINEVQVKIAWRASNRERLTISAPILAAPVLLAEWELKSEAGQRLIYRGGKLTPANQDQDGSGFAALFRLGRSQSREEIWGGLGAILGLIILAALVWRLAMGGGVHKYSARHLLGGLLGLAGCSLAVFFLLHFARLASTEGATATPDLRFVAPVQQSDSALTVEISNLPAIASAWTRWWQFWPALIAAPFWFYGLVLARTPGGKRIARLAGWTLLFWAALRAYNGASGFFLLAIAFLLIEIAIPSLRRWWAVPLKPSPGPEPSGLAARTALLCFGTLMAFHDGLAQPASTSPTNSQTPLILPESVLQEIRVQEDFIFGRAKVRWAAVKGQLLPLLHFPGVLTRIDYPTQTVRLVQMPIGAKSGQALLAEKSATVDVEFTYQTQVSAREAEKGFTLPTLHGLVNRVTLTLAGLNVDLNVPDAVSIIETKSEAITNSTFSLVLAPKPHPWIGWKPRARNTRREKAVFYAEFFQLYVPAAGVVEGLHQVQIRPAQGELTELGFDVPAGLTITDVVAPALTLWRFDPVARKLRVGLAPAQAKPFSLLIKSQTPTGPLPFEHSTGLIELNQAAGQVGLLGVATGSEVQLDQAKVEELSPINLEDFPAAVLDSLRSQVAGLTLRNAYRYSNPRATMALKASPVEPDLRVDAHQTVSLGEDRTVLAANLNVTITRAGIFKLSFLLPPLLEVESLSGTAVSHWTELKTEPGRLITVHLKSRTEGTQQLDLTLTGPGIRPAPAWDVPRVIVREAAKQTGQLLVVPEQGLRLQIASREGLTQLDPIQSGVRQKGVLAFRVLQKDWKLGLDIERVEAWTQVTSLQHVIVGDSQIRVAGNLQYEIENAGLKTLRVRLPAGAESVRFRGEQVSDYLLSQSQTNAPLRDWEIKLQRRVSGTFLLQVNYNLPLSDRATNAMIQGIEAQEVNLQRGFLTIQSASRLQGRIARPPAGLQPAEWQSIPRALQKDLQGRAADYTFRMSEPVFQLALQLDRHQAAKLLPARVESVGLTSVISDDGILLTQARLVLIPGDKQLLHLTLPAQAQFWFAFVGDNSVWPWRERTQILIPLEQHSKTTEPITVEFLYTVRAGTPRSRSLDLALLGPQFDLPLENITWRVFLNEKWKVEDWSGSMQLQEERFGSGVALDLAAYLQKEASLRPEKTREAGEFLSKANSFLEQGDPEQARRAFRSAYGLSQHDSAFNEDARVQLHNLKTQQALVGLNVRQAKVAGESEALAAAPRNLREGLNPAYTQQEARQLMDRNTDEDNAVQLRLVERLIQQQEAVVANPAAIRASVPEQGRVLTFTRSLHVNADGDLKIELRTTERRTASGGAKLGLLAGIFAVAGGLIWFSQRMVAGTRSGSN